MRFDKKIYWESSIQKGESVYSLFIQLQKCGKTGTTDEAGSCLALTVQNKKGVPYIAVILNARDKNMLYDDMTTLLSHIND